MGFNGRTKIKTYIYKIQDDVQCGGSCTVDFYIDADCRLSGTAGASKSTPWRGPYSETAEEGRGDFGSNVEEVKKELDNYESVSFWGNCAALEFMDEDEGYSPGNSENVRVEWGAGGPVANNGASFKTVSHDRRSLQCMELPSDLKNDLGGVKIVAR